MRSLARPALALAIALCAAPAAAQEEAAPGSPAPPFTLRALNPEACGRPLVSIEDYAGAEPVDEGARAVLVSFFASWCEPCKAELPFLVQLDRMYRDRGLRVISVSLDAEPEAIDRTRGLVAAAGVRHPVLSDRFSLVARRWLGDPPLLPAVFVVGRDGLVARAEKGYGEGAAAALLAAVQEALGLRTAGAAPSARTAASAAR